MSATIDQALCIRHWDWSETSQTVVLFTKTNGILRGLAKGSKRDKGKFSGGFDVLSQGEIGFLLKRDSELATLTEWDVCETFPNLRDNLQANKAGWSLENALKETVVRNWQSFNADWVTGKNAPSGQSTLPKCL